MRKKFTKKKMIFSSVYLPAHLSECWLAAAAIAGVSRSELLRLALREKTNRILNQPRSKQSRASEGVENVK